MTMHIVHPLTVQKLIVLLLPVVVLSTAGCADGGPPEPVDGGPGLHPTDAGPDVDSGTPDIPEPPPPDPTRFIDGPTMNVARVNHTMTVLDDGRVLVVGGETGVDDPAHTRELIDSIEIFDPATQTFTELNSLRDARSNHAAIKLNDGTVLIVGGGQSTYSSQPAGIHALSSAVLFDPTDLRTRTTGSLHVARGHFGAAKLADGRVLVAGGGAGTHVNGGGTCTNIPSCTTIADALDSVEIYEPASGVWTTVMPLEQKRFSFTLTAVGDRAYAIGGTSEDPIGLSSVDVFDGSTGEWSSGASLIGPPRQHHSAIALDDGRVLVVGGKNPNVSPLDRVDLYDPDLDAWSAVGNLSARRTGIALARLPSGNILALGGFEQLDDGTVDTVEWISDVAVTPFASLDGPRLASSAALLHDGTLLVCGGTDEFGAAMASCKLGVP